MEGSGWMLELFDHVMLAFSKIPAIVGSSYKPLPMELANLGVRTGSIISTIAGTVMIVTVQNIQLPVQDSHQQKNQSRKKMLLRRSYVSKRTSLTGQV